MTERKTNRALVLAASCFVVLCVGSLYAWSVFAGPMAEHLSALTGREIASLAIVFTVANAVGPITMISGGAINDRLGPRMVLLAGGLLFGFGMIGAGFSRSVAALIACYGLGCGLGNGMIYGTVVSNAVKFFPDKSGFVGGLTTACYGGSSILIPPLANALMNHMPVTSAFKVLGAAMLVILCASAFIIQKAPNSAPVKNAVMQKDYTWREMIRDRRFVLMLLTLCCGAFAGMMFISQAAVIARNMMGFSPARAAAVVSLLALFNTLGRLAAGSLSDRFGAVGTMRATFAVSALAGLLLFLCAEGKDLLFYTGIALTGFSFGSIMGIYPGFTAAQFGRKNNSVNYGIMFIGFALAGLFGPSLMNILHSATGRYQIAFLVSAGLALLGELLLMLMKKQTNQR
ncbi:MAG: OFA family MFS transporter [bacterium]|nr:OFA family MFS transporter [bacterium]